MIKDGPGEMHARVAEILKSNSIEFRIHRHADYDRKINSPQDFADALGYDLCRITKTLYVRCKSSDVHAVIVCPMGRKADMRGVAAELGCSKVQIAPSSELQDELGYPSGSVSPVGIGEMPVFMDESLFSMPTILIGAGENGVELELSPFSLRDLTAAFTLALAV